MADLASLSLSVSLFLCPRDVPALCTHRPSLLPIERFSEVLGLFGRRITLPAWREDDQTVAFRGSKSRNKVSVGEPAEGSLSVAHTCVFNTVNPLGNWLASRLVSPWSVGLSAGARNVPAWRSDLMSAVWAGMARDCWGTVPLSFPSGRSCGMFPTVQRAPASARVCDLPPVGMCSQPLFCSPLLRSDLWTQVWESKTQHYTVDHLARGSMKNGANSVMPCELQDTWTSTLWTHIAETSLSRFHTWLRVG